MRHIVTSLVALLLAAPVYGQQPQPPKYRNSLPVFSPDGKSAFLDCVATHGWTSTRGDTQHLAGRAHDRFSK